MVGVRWGGEKAQASYQQVQDFRCCHLYHFLCLGVSWPASLAGARMRHKGDRRGESSTGEVDDADFRLPSGVLYFLYLLGEKQLVGAWMWPVVWNQERFPSLFFHSLSSFLSSESPPNPMLSPLKCLPLSIPAVPSYCLPHLSPGRVPLTSVSANRLFMHQPGLPQTLYMSMSTQNLNKGEVPIFQPQHFPLSFKIKNRQTRLNS